MIKFLICILFLPLIQCSHSNIKNYIDLQFYDAYLEKIRLLTHNRKDYNGLYNSYEVTLSLLTSDLQLDQIKLKAQMYQLGDQTQQEDLNEVNSIVNTQTQVFLSFYSPERHYDHLDIKSKSVWKAYLEIDGLRYEGSIKKDTRLLGEIQKYYPYHNRYSSPYIISFPVPSSAIEGKASKVTLTGPLGIAEVEYLATVVN